MNLKFPLVSLIPVIISITKSLNFGKNFPKSDSLSSLTNIRRIGLPNCGNSSRQHFKLSNFLKTKAGLESAVIFVWLVV